MRAIWTRFSVAVRARLFCLRLLTILAPSALCTGSSVSELDEGCSSAMHSASDNCNDVAFPGEICGALRVRWNSSVVPVRRLKATDEPAGRRTLRPYIESECRRRAFWRSWRFLRPRCEPALDLHTRAQFVLNARGICGSPDCVWSCSRRRSKKGPVATVPHRHKRGVFRWSHSLISRPAWRNSRRQGSRRKPSQRSS